MPRSLILVPLLLVGFLCPPFLTTAGAAAHSDIRIAVLALRGEEAALQSWQATADYLNRKIPSQQFRIVPYDFTAIVPAARQHAYHFVITNPSIYIELEELCGASRIATLRRQVAGRSQTRFGGVIFCRSERTDLQTLTDLKNRRFMAAGENSLGGWRMAWYELKAAGIEPAEHFAQLRFGGSHDAVVAAVAQGAVDAGTVRTGILEDLAATGVIRLTDFRILQPRQHEGFDLLHSTDLYPEWPIAVLPQTDASLAQQVTIALLEMADNDPAAQAAASVGWTVPQDYTRLHELFKALRLGPYRDYGSFTFTAVLRQYGWVLLGATAAIVLLLLYTAFVLRLNGRLKRTHAELAQAHQQLKAAQFQLLQQEKLAAIGQLAAGIAHEINNPAGFVLSNLGTLARYAERIASYLHHVDERCQQLPEALAEACTTKREELKIAELLADLPELIAESRSGMERIRRIVADLRKSCADGTTRRDLIDLNDCLRHCLAQLKDQLAGLQIELELAELPALPCAPQQIELLLTHLLQNAAQAMAGRGRLGLRSWMEDGELHLCVSDTGPGIPSELLGKIFEPFFTTREVGQGTGLGLNLCYEIARSHGGQIRVTSQPGQGSSFTLSLPLDQASDVAASS
ncbi:MAG: PhnD/SsuA/transferrin family substrate-binding protein [Desulfuromonas thiophila]|nr:PhnD/SsuA/transferrin family substrate-binding protein [Desulfuromonas thiophila]